MRHIPVIRVVLLAAAMVSIVSVSAWADTVVLKDGRVLQGTFKSATAAVIIMDIDGKAQEIAIGDITSLTFSPRAAAPAAAPAAGAPAAAPAAASARVPGTLAAGTKMMLRTRDPISTASHKQGAKVTALVENDLAVNGAVVVLKGTTVYGTVTECRGGRLVGGAMLVITFDQLSVNNQMIAIVTDDVGAQSEPGGTAKKVGAGALIGGAAGDAGAGAAVGGAVALMAAKGNHLQIAPGTLVEVSLKQPVAIP